MRLHPVRHLPAAAAGQPAGAGGDRRREELRSGPLSGRGYLTAELSPAAVGRNLERLRALLPPGTRICAVVKDDAYGLGLEPLLPAIAEHADWLAVATPAEALALRRRGWGGPVLCFFSLSALPDAPAAAAELAAAGVTLTVVSAAEAAQVAGAGSPERPCEVHLKVDTGMARAGIWHQEAGALAAALAGEPRLRLTGIYTHLATADEADKSFAREQLQRFAEVCALAGGGLCRHAANSAAIMDLPDSHLDMVRPGVAIYGYLPSPEIANPLPLEPCLRLTSRLLQVKTVPAGTTTGYGREHTFGEPATLGLVPVGYGDGYPRALGNRAAMRIGGRVAPVRGRVSMDQVVIDLTGLPPAAPGDEVEVVADDPAAANSVENLARLAGTIPYELTCRLAAGIERRVADGKVVRR